MPATCYCIGERDEHLLRAATALLNKVASAETLRPAELVSVAKLQHVFSRLPQVTPYLEVTVSVIGSRRKFGEIETWHYWDIGVEGEMITIGSGGHYYHPQTGGDSFTTMQWTAVPEEPAELDDYLDHLSIVPDARSFADGATETEFLSGDYRIEVTDPNNDLLEDKENHETES